MYHTLIIANNAASNNGIMNIPSPRIIPIITTGEPMKRSRINAAMARVNNKKSDAATNGRSHNPNSSTSFIITLLVHMEGSFLRDC